MYLSHEVVDQNDKQLAILFKGNDAPMPIGTMFLTPESSQQQVGVIKRHEGFHIPPHTHVKQERSVIETAEVLIVQEGLIQVKIYDVDGKYQGKFYAGDGDVVVLMRGGHSVQFVEDSQLLEVKTGPYRGRANDKVDIQVKE